MIASHNCDSPRDQYSSVIDAKLAIFTAPMRVCIDARMLGSDGTGVARYARTLVDSLVEAGLKPLLLRADPANTSRLGRWLASARLNSRFAHENAGYQEDSTDRSLVARDLFREAQLHFDLYGRLMPVHCAGPPGVMHWTYPLPVTMRGWRNVYTVHDVIPLDRQRLSPIRAKRHGKMLRAIARSADRLVTVSNAARLDIIETLGCEPTFVTDTSQAVSVFSDAQADPEVGETGEYFLFCGTLEPRKNLIRLAQAYKLSGASRTLVIVGPNGWNAESIRRTLDHPNILILPFQPRERLVQLIRHARAMLFPSLSEGFGLPIAEAMTLGIPVMTSAGGATAEVAGDAALLIDPLDVDAMAAAIRRLDSDDVLCERLSMAGLQRSIAFRPLPYAHRLIELYAELLNTRSSSQ